MGIFGSGKRELELQREIWALEEKVFLLEVKVEKSDYQMKEMINERDSFINDLEISLDMLDVYELHYKFHHLKRYYINPLIYFGKGLEGALGYSSSDKSEAGFYSAFLCIARDITDFKEFLERAIPKIREFKEELLEFEQKIAALPSYQEKKPISLLSERFNIGSAKGLAEYLEVKRLFNLDIKTIKSFFDNEFSCIQAFEREFLSKIDYSDPECTLKVYYSTELVIKCSDL